MDVGRYPAHERKDVCFTLANRGDAPLRITNVRKPCGCMTAEIGKSELAPGEKTELKVGILPGSVTGAYSKPLYVESNDPGARFVGLTVSGTAVQLLAVKPQPTVYAGRLPAGQAWTQVFVLEAAEDGVELGAPVVEGAPGAKVVLQADGPRATKVLFEARPESGGELKWVVKVPVLKPAGWPPVELGVTGKCVTRAVLQQDL